jgi:hypothetical protein
VFVLFVFAFGIEINSVMYTLNMTEQPFDKTEIVENDLFAEWLGESRYMTHVIVDITHCLALLASKRVTLEEKMISQELHALVSNYGEILALVHAQLATGAKPDWPTLERLRTMNFHVKEEIGVFLKALRYNFNYVEQYFEFNFCARLREECGFSTESAEILTKLKAASNTGGLS